jgi:hypothetical protein
VRAKAKSKVKGTSASLRRSALALLLTMYSEEDAASCVAAGLGFGAHDARYKGPVSGGGRAQERPVGWARGIAPSLLPAHGGAVSEPPEPWRGVGGQEPGDLRFGVAFSLVPFSDFGLLPFALRASCAVRAAPAAQWPRKRKTLARREASDTPAWMPRDEGRLHGCRR